MARTGAGDQLSAQHRRAQLGLRAQAMRDFQRIWPLWKGDERSFRDLVAATQPLVLAHHRTSASLASAFYQAFRTAERVGGSPAPRLPDPPDPKKIEASLYATGQASVRKAIAAGHSPQAAMQNALVTTSGAVTRHILDGGRGTIIQSAAADRRARGWARVTSGDPCAFCAMLAMNGAVYSEYTVDFQAHDHCSCSGEVVYEGYRMPPNSQRFKDFYNQATREANAAGDMDRGTSNDLLNAFRRHLANQ